MDVTKIRINMVIIINNGNELFRSNAMKIKGCGVDVIMRILERNYAKIVHFQWYYVITEYSVHIRLIRH